MLGRTRGPGAAHDTQRAALLDAALVLVGRDGIGAATQAAVAAAAGVSPGRVQHYFPTRQSLLIAALDRTTAAATARIVARLGGPVESAPPLRTLAVVLDELIPFDDATRAHLQFRQSYTALGLHHDEIAAELVERYHRLHRRDLAGLLHRAVADGSLDRGIDVATTAVALAALAEGLAFYVLIGVTPATQARTQLGATLDDLRASTSRTPTHHPGDGGPTTPGSGPEPRKIP